MNVYSSLNINTRTSSNYTHFCLKENRSMVEHVTT